MLKSIPLPAVLIDVETTGGSATYGRITEIGIVEIDEDGVHEWSTLINPAMNIPLDIQNITGITNEMVASAPRFEDVAEIILEKIKGKLFIAHNVQFDYGFVTREFSRLGIYFEAERMCSVQLSRTLYPEQPSHSLEAIIQRNQIFVRYRHRALDDAKATYTFLKIAEEEHGVEKCHAAVLKQFQKEGLPSTLDPVLINSLPNKAGVYYFWNGANELLHIGKSKKIRDGVLFQFANRNSSSHTNSICEKTRDITWETTGGELSALILYSQKITELHPTYNKKPQIVPTLHSILLKENELGWIVPEVVSAENIVHSKHRLYGLFTSIKKAKNAIKQMTDQYGLCHRATNLEKAEAGPCTGYMLKKCKGLCIGTQSYLLHNVKILQAFNDLILEAWPYKGPIVLIEKHSGKLGSQHIILNNWCLLGVANDLADYDEILSGNSTPRLDRNIYRYLTKALFTKSSSLKIEQLSGAF